MAGVLGGVSTVAEAAGAGAGAGTGTGGKVIAGIDGYVWTGRSPGSYKEPRAGASSRRGGAMNGAGASGTPGGGGGSAAACAGETVPAGRNGVIGGTSRPPARVASSD